MFGAKKELIEKALVAALKERQKVSGEIYDPFCLFDFIEEQDVQLKFVDISSLEGIYSKEPGPLILLSSLRPHGRQYFNCAHEYGHHVFDHGMELDEVIDSKNSGFKPKEFLVDTFAGFFLMPKSTIKRAFNIRNVGFDEFNPLGYYKIASNLGVGYQTILYHLLKSLRMIEKSLYKKLSSVKVQEIKKEILCQSFPGEVIYVDRNWEGRPVDIQVNDILAIEGNCQIESNNVKQIDRVSGISIYKGINTGIGRIRFQMQNKVHFLRVARHQYVGFNKYKHLETEI